MTLLSESDNAKPDSDRDEQKPKSIALAMFRFRGRRGLGVYYALLSTVPVLVGVLQSFSSPAYLTLISVGLLVLGILFLARLAGMKRLYQMRLVMGLFEQYQSRHRERLNRVFESARTVIVTLLPLGAAAIYAVTNSAILGLLVLFVFVSYVLAYYLLVISKKSDDIILPLRTVT